MSTCAQLRSSSGYTVIDAPEITYSDLGIPQGYIAVYLSIVIEDTKASSETLTRFDRISLPRMLVISYSNSKRAVLTTEVYCGDCTNTRAMRVWYETRL
jgi:hypothetical protein